MKRDPYKEYIKEHIDSISIKKNKPRFSYKRCVKCRMEYKKEEMYKCSWLDKTYMNYNKGNYANHNMFGCTNCFSSEGKFIKYLEDNEYLYTEESLEHYYTNGW